MPGFHPDRHGFAKNRQGFTPRRSFSDDNRWQGTDQFGCKGNRGQLQQRHSRALFAALVGLVPAQVLDPAAAQAVLAAITGVVP